MSPALAVPLFFVLLSFWILIAFLPGIIELRRRRDIDPLRVVPESEVKIRHFARRFRELVDRELRGIMKACKEAGGTREGVLPDGSAYLAVAGGRELPLSAEEERASCTERLVLSSSDLSLPESSSYLGEVYIDGSLRGGMRNIYRAVFAERNLRLEEESSSLRWLHAGDTFEAGTDCALYGRVSADKLLRLAESCRFERLNAPRIEFGGREGEDPPARSHSEDLKLVEPRDLPHVVEFKAGRCLVLGNLELPARSLFEVDLVVKGRVKIGEGSRFVRSLKSGKNMVLGDGVEIDGSVVSGRGLKLGKGCSVHGPLLAERDVVLGEGCLLGSEEKPTTLSAERAEIGVGTVIHGTVWAHRSGRVAGPAAEGEAEDA